MFVKRYNKIAVTREFEIIAKRKWQQEYLHTIFHEYKYLYNYLVKLVKTSQKLPTDSEVYKIQETDLGQEIKYLASHMKLKVKRRILIALKSLKELAKLGQNGELKYKRNIDTIELTTQTFKFSEDFRHVTFMGIVRLFGRGKRFYVRGASQIEQLRKIDPNFQIGDSYLVRVGNKFYLKIVFWLDSTKYIKWLRQQRLFSKPLAIDFGVADVVTFSNGLKIKVDLRQTNKRIEQLQSKISKCRQKTKKRYKLQLQLKREYQRLRNKRRELRNKILAYCRRYSLVIFQDDLIKGWTGNWGSKVLGTSVGSLKSKLKESLLCLAVVPKTVATSKTCSNCNAKLDLKLSERIIKCPSCNFVCDRDVNATFNMLKYVGLERTECLPYEHDLLLKYLGSNDWVVVHREAAAL